jgi:hypothetical protein
MGMFDSISCKYKLPQPENPQGFTGTTDFQTKDFENALDLYLIKEDGALYRVCAEYSEIDPNFESKSIFDFPHREKIREWEEPQIVTKTIQMYDYINCDDGDFDFWIEYELIFVDGVVKSATIAKFEATDNKQRKENNKKFEKEMREYQEFRKTFFYRFFYQYYCKFVDFLTYKVMSKLGQFLQSNSYKLNKLLKIK